MSSIFIPISINSAIHTLINFSIEIINDFGLLFKSTSIFLKLSLVLSDRNIDVDYPPFVSQSILNFNE